MAKKPVDLDKVRKALAEIEQTLQEHPEARERTAAFLAGDLDEGECCEDERYPNGCIGKEHGDTATERDAGAGGPVD